MVEDLGGSPCLAAMVEPTGSQGGQGGSRRFVRLARRETKKSGGYSEQLLFYFNVFPVDAVCINIRKLQNNGVPGEDGIPAEI